MKTSDLTHIALGTAFVCSCSNLFATTSFSCTLYTSGICDIFLIRTNATTPKPNDSPNVHPARSSWFTCFRRWKFGNWVVWSGKTGGFLLSFPFCAYLISWMHKRFDTYGYWVGITVGLCITYAAGVLQLSFISNTPFRVILWGIAPITVNGPS